MGSSNILITGAGGFTGTHACRYFSKKGYKVIPVIRKNKATGYVCDLTDQSGVNTMIQEIQPDYILHLAGENNVDASWRDPSGCFLSNVLGTIYLLEAVRQYTPKSKLLITGSMLEYDPLNSLPAHPYSFTKTLQTLSGCAWNHFYNTSVYMVRPSNLIGPGPSNGICPIIAHKIILAKHTRDPQLTLDLHNALAERDFLDVRDAVKAYDIVFEKGVPGEVYEIGSEVSRTLESVVNTFDTLGGLPIHVRWTAREQTTPVKIDNQKIRALGWQPKYNFVTSIKDILMYFEKDIGDS